eukprot:s459_g17.t1
MSSQNTPWRCIYCKRLNKAVAQHCGSCELPWNRCFDVQYVHGQKNQKSTKEQAAPTYAHWDGAEEGWGRGYGTPRSSSGKRNTPRGKKGDTPRNARRQAYRETDHASPFQPIGANPPPWPSADTSFAAPTSTSPFGPLAPLPPPTTPPPQPTVQENTALVLAIKEEFPDMSKAPANIRAAVEKAEAQNTSRIAADLQRNSQKVKKASEKLRELRESQIRHKESWQRHLQEALACWEGQVQSYTTQQNNYKEMMEKTRAELHAARKDIQRLNHLVAGTAAAATTSTVDLTEPELIAIDDSDTTALMERMQSTLFKCSQLFLKPADPPNRAVSVHSDEEGFDAEMAAPASKRQRSTDAGKDAAVPPRGSGGLPSS